MRNVLERASARETAARVAGGALAKAFLRALGVEVVSHVVQIGPVRADGARAARARRPSRASTTTPSAASTRRASAAMVEHINVQRKANESIGGVFEVRAYGVVPGLGSHVSWEERLDGRLAMALASIQSCKGVGLGEGFDLAGKPGSQAHDEIFYSDERGFYRETNHSGGLEGGMTTGEPLVCRAALKPLPTLTKPLRSVDIETLEPAQALRERTDSCVVPAGAVVGEAMVASCSPAPTARSSAATTSTTCARRSSGTRSGSGGGARRAGDLPAPRLIVLVGFMGAGKSTAAREIAADRGVDAIDADALLDERLGTRSRRSSPSTARRSSAGARRSSCSSCSTAAATRSSRSAAARSSRARVREALRGAPRRAARRRRGHRVGARADLRPAAGARPRGVRARCSRAAARCTTRSPTSSSPPRAASRAARRCARPRPARAACGRGRPAASTRSSSGAACATSTSARRAARSCVTDEGVAAAVGAGAPDHVMPAGRGAQDARDRRARLARARAARASRAATTSARSAAACVGDLAGFCAATYQRGIPVVQVPTTLVAQVDAAIGGKTGVDLPEAKNYVGAYHQPLAVLADLETLATLPPTELAGGLRRGGQDRADRRRPAVGARRGRRRGRRGRRSSPARGRRSRVVAADERDGGRRQVLNLGHTVAPRDRDGHRLRASRTAPAVGLGLLAALRLSGQDALRAQVAELLARAGPADDDDGLDVDAVVAATRRDKKRIGAEVPFVLVAAPGDVRHGRPVPRRRRCAPPWKSCGGDEEPRGGHARRQPRPARAPRPAALRRARLRRARAADRAASPASSASSRGSSTPTTRASSSSTCTGSRAWPTPSPQPGRVDALLLRDPRRARADAGCRPSRSTCPTSMKREEFRRVSVFARHLHRRR